MAVEIGSSLGGLYREVAFIQVVVKNRFHCNTI